MFTETLFIVSRAWQQPRCPSTDERLKKWYIHTMEYYSATKRKEVGSSLVIWRDLESVTQSEVSQKDSNKYHIIYAYIWNLEKWYWWTYLQGRNRDSDLENGLVDTGLGRGGWGEFRDQWSCGHQMVSGPSKYSHSESR